MASKINKERGLIPNNSDTIPVITVPYPDFSAYFWLLDWISSYSRIQEAVPARIVKQPNHLIILYNMLVIAEKLEIQIIIDHILKYFENMRWGMVKPIPLDEVYYIVEEYGPVGSLLGEVVMDMVAFMYSGGEVGSDEEIDEYEVFLQSDPMVGDEFDERLELTTLY